MRKRKRGEDSKWREDDHHFVYRSSFVKVMFVVLLWRASWWAIFLNFEYWFKLCGGLLPLFYSIRLLSHRQI